MSMSNNRDRTLVFLSCLIALVALGQESETPDQTRQLWDESFNQRRQSKDADAALNPSPPKPRQKAAAPIATKQSKSEQLADSLIGVTLWRLRPARSGDPESAVIVATSTERLVAERIEVGTPLKAGDRLRIGIEVARSGYLYLVDRERYADGTTGDPFLIFPRLRIRGGDNRVRAGRLIEIPDLDDTPPFFTLKPNRPDYAGETLTVIVAPEPMADLRPGRTSVELAEAQVSKWEKQWGGPTQRIELAGGAGTLYTGAERQSAVGTRLLTQEEPAPQTMYRVESKPGSPMLFQVPLEVQKEE